MQYRTLGKTGIEVSALGFGAMRLPMVDEHVDYPVGVPLLRRGLELGITYIDTAHGYCNGTSEIAVGKAIADWPRDKVFISTKGPVNNPEHVKIWRERLESQLKRFNTPYIDFYNCHNLSWEEYNTLVNIPGGVLEQAERAKADGLIRYLSLSCHDTPDNMKRIIDTGHFATMTLQYNLLDRTNTEVIAHAHAAGVGIIIMGPVGGGRLGVDSAVIKSFLPTGQVIRSTPEIALRFVLTNPGVTVALSGMNEMSHIEENVVTAGRAEPLSAAEMDHVAEALDETKRLADLYCTGCNYCMPCPNGVKIPDNFKLMNYHRLYGLTDFARKEYAKLALSGDSAAECLECNECEPKCPQNLPIIKQLQDVVAALG